MQRVWFSQAGLGTLHRPPSVPTSETSAAPRSKDAVKTGNCLVLYFHVSKAFGLLSTCPRARECVHVPFSKNAARLWLLLMGSSPSLRRLTQFLATDTPTFTPSLQRVGGAARKKSTEGKKRSLLPTEENILLEAYFNCFSFISLNSEILPEGNLKRVEDFRTFVSNANLVSFAHRLCRSFTFFFSVSGMRS